MKISQMKETKYISQGDVENPKVLTFDRLTNENVAGENKPEEMKWIGYFKEAQKGLVLNWTNIQLMAAIMGSEDSDDWTGKQVELYVDPTVSFGGKIVGGVRVRKPSGGQPTAAPEAPKAVPADDFDDNIPF